MNLDQLNLKIDKTNYKCTLCYDNGYILDENGWYNKECECQIKKRNILNTELNLKKSGLENIKDKYTFDNYYVNTEWQRDFKQRAMRFTETPLQAFVMLGQTSLGKTHLLSAMTIEMVFKGKRALYFKWQSEIIKIKNNFWNINDELLDKLLNVEVLYIDDFLKVDSLDNIHQEESRLAFAIIDHRLNNDKLITLISSEWSIKELGQYNGALAGRIVEMCGGLNSYNLIDSSFKEDGNRRLIKNKRRDEE